MRNLMWFRNDLRVEDNFGLYHAVKAADNGVVGLFIICPKQWAEHDWGDVKVDFVMRNVKALSEKLDQMGIPLKIMEVDRFKDVPKKIVNFVKDYECGAVYWNREYEINELARDTAVSEALNKLDVEVHEFDDQVVVRPDAIKTGSGDFYKVFTPYKKSWCEYVDQRELEILKVGKVKGALNEKGDEVPKQIKGFKKSHVIDIWQPGEDEAKNRLEAFIKKHAEDYKKERDYPALDSTSGLSPYLACGAISIRVCLHKALDANDGLLNGGDEGLKCWISELVWREFYRHVLVGYEWVCKGKAFKHETDDIEWNDDKKAFKRWCEGKTGIPIVDAAMRQLNQTGWMHNRLRMIVAMYLTKNLWIDWRWGERYFMNKLIDGDFASNNGGWQWSASTGTDAAPYFRIMNPVTQGERYDPDGEFVTKYCPELKDLPVKKLHNPQKWDKNLFEQTDYPEMQVDLKKSRQAAIDAFKASQ